MINYLSYGEQVESNLKEPQNTPEIKTPCGPGWLEYKLNTQEMDYLWRCIDNVDKKPENKINSNLAGNIDSTFFLEDKDDWFFNNTLTPLTNFYENSFANESKKAPLFSKKDRCCISFYRNMWWVNFQKQYEFNPLHSHDGLYSFVIWLKIPYEWKEQNNSQDTNSKLKGSFSFHYLNIFGEPSSSVYALDKGFEGTLLFFPSKLNHQVYPFYNCDEYRISISGNIFLDI